MSEQKKTVILGASDNPERTSYLAIQKLKAKHHPIVAIGRKAATIDGTTIITGQPTIEGVDTVTLYLSAANQKVYYDYILSLHPKRIIFNPGAENEELFDLAKANGIKPLEACTLVMLSTGQY
jgi:hypothetical protein